MQKSNSQTKLFEVSKLDAMSEAEQDVFLAKVGGIITDAALGRLLLSLSEDEATKLKSYVDATEDGTDLVIHLLKTYPDFEKLLHEEAESLQSEVSGVFE